MKTKVYFGKGQIENLDKIVSQYGKKVLFVYGGGSIKKNGVYDSVVRICKRSGITLFELAGVEPNPTVYSARRGVELAKREGVDCVIAAGGGSAIDCAKAIAAGALYEGDVWDFYSYKTAIEKALPIVGILTLAASGTEMSIHSVITNPETMEKHGTGSLATRLSEAICDPTYTFSVNAYHTAAGVADIMSHIMEGYFSDNDGYLQNRVCEALLKTCIEFGKRVIDEPDNYEARAQIMWASTCALNRFLAYGRRPTMFECHTMEHIFSAKYDISHGAGLAVITPSWLRFALRPQNEERFTEFGKNVFGLNGASREVAERSIDCLEGYFNSLGLPSKLRDFNIPEGDLPLLAKTIYDAEGGGDWYVPVTEADILKVLKAAY